MRSPMARDFGLIRAFGNVFFGPLANILSNNELTFDTV